MAPGSAGHNFGDMVDIELPEARSLLEVCTRMMNTIQDIPRRHRKGACTCDCPDANWCRHVTWQLLLSRQGLLYREERVACSAIHRLVAVARQINRKHAMELAITGDAIDSHTAASWGLINRVVADDQLDDAVRDLMASLDSWFSDGEGHWQACLLRPGRYGAAEGICLRDGSDGSWNCDARFAGRHQRILREAPARIQAICAIAAKFSTNTKCSPQESFGGATTPVQIAAMLGECQLSHIPSISSDSTTPSWSLPEHQLG